MCSFVYESDSESVSLHTPYVISVDGGLFMVMLWYSVPASCAKERLLTAVTAGFFMVMPPCKLALPTGVCAILGPTKITRDMGTGIWGPGSPKSLTIWGPRGRKALVVWRSFITNLCIKCKRSVIIFCHFYICSWLIEEVIHCLAT